MRVPKTPIPIPCAIYARASSTEDELPGAASIIEQVIAMRAFIIQRAFLGWVYPPKAYEDVGYSDSSLKRPAMKKLIAAMRAGKVKCVVFHTLDRVTLSVPDLQIFMDECRNCGVLMVIVSPVTTTLSWLWPSSARNKMRARQRKARKARLAQRPKLTRSR